MPLITFKPTVPPLNPTVLPRVEPAIYKGAVVDDKYTALSSLSAYAEGMPMTVTYYGQILGESNDVREADPAQSAVYQQYTKTNGLEIRVDQDLSMVVQNETNLSTITGSANITPAIVPNTFDYFTTRTSRGRLTLFRISNVERKSMQRDSMHEITYNMVGYVDSPGEAKNIYDTIERKVTNEYFYRADRLIDGLNPIVKTADNNSIENLYEDYRRIVAYYFSTFVNISFKTLVLPGMPVAVYDKFLVDFLFKITSIEDYEGLDRIKQLSADQDRYTEQPQFWKALIERNKLYIQQANKMMAFVDRRLFIRSSRIGGTGVSAIDNYVYPTTVDLSSSINNYPSIKLSNGTYVNVIPEGGTFFSSGTNMLVTALGSIPLYKAVLGDTYYVLSQAFYEQQDNWCVLEKVVWDYLESNAIQLNELSALCAQFYTLNRLEQFYYGPLLMLLIKDSRLNVYSQ